MKNAITIETGFHSSSGKKEVNHDSCGVVVPSSSLLAEKGIVAAIADGMSSSAGAKQASETCVKSLLQDYLDTPASWTVKTAATRVIAATNRWLCSQGQAQYHSDLGMASTLSAVILKGKQAHIFHIGDSRIYLLREGKLKQLTSDHREASQKKADYLARAMGADIDLAIDYKTIEIRSGDIFLLTTDGIHDVLQSSDMVKLLEGNASDLESSTRMIVESALAAGSEDNLTCLILSITNLAETDYQSEGLGLPFPPDLSPGMVLDGHKVIRELHASNRSQLYLTESVKTGDALVLKTPSVNFSDNADYIERFHRESWIGRQITSPHVMKIMPDHSDKKFLYTAMDYIEGQTLREWMRDNPTSPLNKVRDIIGQVSKGLRALHRKEIIHQDLKPENIMITESGTCIIIDFGSAKVLGFEEACPMVDVEHGIGTVTYSAPEMLIGQPTGPAADLYSLATLTYELLTGKLPYSRPLTSERRILNAVYRPISESRDDVPYWMDRAIQKALSVQPRKRHDALSSYMHDLSYPNIKFREQQRPLIERNPVVFWKATSFILAVLLVGMLVS